MKTLAVLSALMAVAFSAPTLPEAGNETHQTKSSQDLSLLATGKTASSQTFDGETLHDIGNTSPLQLDASHESLARLHLGLKKPIIIKKKLGSSHLYRSSGEEQAQADPQEACMQEVKVNLCHDVKTTATDTARSTITEDVATNTMNSDVEKSIKMAKEAVENLQRGLLNMEHNPDAKMSQWKHPESDVEMHQDIEVARQALEHIQQNFGNLESMNLQATTLKDTDQLHDTDMQITESEEGRLAQWKEAIDNIQRNIEIAKNVEDSFKPAAQELASTDSKSLNKMDTEEKKSKSHETVSKPDLLHEDLELQQHDSDMTVSASSPVEVKIKPESKVSLLENKVMAETEELGENGVTEENVTTNTNITKEISTESDDDLASKNKMIELKSEDKSKELKNSETAPKSSEKNIETEPAQSVPLTTSMNKFKEDLEHISSKKSAIEKGKSASAWKEPVEKALLAKATENEKSTDFIDTDRVMKSEDQVEKKQEHKLNTADDLTAMQKVQQFSIGKSADALKISEHQKSADHEIEQNAQEKAVSHFTKPTEKISVKHETMTMKSTEEAPILVWEKSADSGSSMQHSTHVDMKASDLPINTLIGKSVHLDSSVAPSTQMEMKAADNHIVQPMGRSAHLDRNLQPQMEKKAIEGKFAMERNKMMQWKQMHEARGAYGIGGYGAGAGGMGAGASGLSGYGSASTGYGSGATAAASNALNIGASAGPAGGSGTGTVGVFPNANVGGCAIPLLLSCSPSVVSGKLANAHSSGYGATGYRMGEDFKYHFKRDTQKTNEIPTTKVKRTNFKRVEKISLDKKL